MSSQVQNWIQIIILKLEHHDDINRGHALRKIEDQSWVDNVKISLRLDLPAVNKETETELDEAFRGAKHYFLEKGSIIKDTKPRPRGLRELPVGQETAWRQYTNYLRESGWAESEIATLGGNCLAVFRNTADSTPQGDPVKGLVVGSVQSGKTANIAGLISIAADHGFNVFLVLTGVLENLRKQTEERLQRDLPSQSSTKWEFELRPLTPRLDLNFALRFSDDSRQALIVTALKNPTRLKALLGILGRRHDASGIKMLIIDDEADQAGINTADMTRENKEKTDRLRTKVNEHLLKLIHLKGASNTCAAVNYIGYTATPQATLLNTREDLFPTDFISLIENPASYFGVRQIAGVDGSEWPGLPILCDVQSDETTTGHPALQESLCWFLCCVSAIRLTEARKTGAPISMLVHTSPNVADHFETARLIKDMLAESPAALLKKCEEVWNTQSAQLTSQEFRNCLPNYPHADSIRDLPRFSDIKDGIRRIIKPQVLVREIREVDVDSAPETENYSDPWKSFEGITIAVDNSASEIAREEMKVNRLAYPTREQQAVMTVVPAYIVVGGATLSRGLTIEGLVSSYFTREVKAADTLLQMGRWFGYRRGYELYPRVWLTRSGQADMRELASFEDSLHAELRGYAANGDRPIDVVPKIQAGHFSRLRVTEPRRMQGAVSSRVSRQTPQFAFPVGREQLQRNFEAANAFVDSVRTATGFNLCSWNSGCYVARDVDQNTISKFLDSYRLFHEESGVAQTKMDAVYSKLRLQVATQPRWNVILAGAKNASNAGVLDLAGVSVNKVRRNAALGKGVEPKTVRIMKALEDQASSNADLPEEYARVFAQGRAPKLDQVFDARANAGLESTARIVLYAIDRCMFHQPRRQPEWLESLEMDTTALVIALPGELGDRKNEYFYVVV
jgi:hypothetical protein